MSVSFGVMDHEETYVNFSNTNARNLLLILGCDPNVDISHGMVKLEDLPLFRQMIIAALNSSKRRRNAVFGGHTDTNGSATIVDCGSTDEQVIRRLRDLLNIVVAAHGLGKGISWC